MVVYFTIYVIMGFLPVLINAFTNKKQKKNSIYIWVSFLCVFFVLALRHQSMGIDLGYKNTSGYLPNFDKISKFTWEEAFTVNVLKYERGYILLNKLISSIWNDRQFFIAVCTFISVFPIAYVIYKKSDDVIFSFIIYMGLPVFLMLFSGIRQSIALGLCFLSFLYIEDKKPIKFIITVLISSLFHGTAIVFLIAYPLYYLKFNQTGRILSVVVFPVIYFFRYQLFNVLSKLFKEDALPDDNGALTLLLIFCLIYIFCFIFAKKGKQVNGVLNLFFIACCCQIFANIYSIAMRVGYYFMLSATLLIPRTLNEVKDNTSLKLVVKAIVVTAFIVFGLFSLYNSDWALAYPYHWFWEIN